MPSRMDEKHTSTSKSPLKC